MLDTPYPYPTALPGGTVAVPSFVALPPGAVVVDYVDIGIPASEAGHNMEINCTGNWPGGGPCGSCTGTSWGPIVNWAGETSKARAVWENGTAGTTSRSSTMTMDFGPAPVDKYIAIRWLDGQASDAFTMEIECQPGAFYELQDVAGTTEIWQDIGVWNVGVVIGVQTLTFTATAPPWSGQTLYGQVTLSEVAVFEDPCPEDNRLSLEVATPLCINTTEFSPDRYVEVELGMACLDQPVRGFQAWMLFNDGLLSFQTGAYTAAPFGLPVITPIGAAGGAIDLAAGIDDAGGQSPTQADAHLATLSFDAFGTATGQTFSFGFDTGRDPPSRFTGDEGQEVTPSLLGSQAVFVDNDDPVVTCTDISVNNDPGDCSAMIACEDIWAGVTATDVGYGIFSLVGVRDDALPLTDPYPAGCPPTSGVTMITWTATDCAGNTDTCVQTITVTDNEAPIISCPTNATVECDESTDPANTGTATATDNCDPPPPSITHADVVVPGPCEDQYDIQRTWTATDRCGNEDSCTQIITVQDTTPPTLIGCPGNATVECDSVPSPPTVTATDNCDPAPTVAYSEVRTDGPCDDTYTLTRTWTATDRCDNEDSCTQIITVQDTTPPVLGSMLASVGPQTFNHPGGGEAGAGKFFLQPGSSWKGDLTLASGVTYSIRMEGIDTSGLPGGTLVRMGFNDSVVWKGFSNDAKLDFYGAGGHLLQSLDIGDTWTAQQSHGFNPGDVPGQFDLRLDVSQSAPGGTWLVTPHYRLAGQTLYSLFYDTIVSGGGWTTPSSFDIAEGHVGVDLGGPNAGTVTIDGMSVIAFPGCPPDINVNADAGLCTAAVDPGMAYAIDNCDPDPLIEYKRSDRANWNEGLLDPYPSGVTTITWRATDDCGNYDECVQTITVSGDNELVVDVQLSPAVSTPLTRCITFELWNCAQGDTSPRAIVSQPITFGTGGLATDVTVLVPCDAYDCITARDELHTLRRTDETFGIVGTQYVADFTGDPDGGGDWLIGGNLNDDRWIDILDFGVFAGQWNMSYGDPPTGDTTCSTTFPHADISGDGWVLTPDFVFIQTNFLLGDEANCCGAPGLPAPGDGPVTAISVAELYARGLAHLAVADLNGDAMVDQADVQAFMMGARPQPAPESAPEFQRVPLRPGRTR